MKHYHFQSITSTNDFVKELIEHEKLVAVTADFQLFGRGRNDTTWYGDYGVNVYCSIGIAHKENPRTESLVLYQAIGCLAVKQTLYELTQQDIFIVKYPNDIYARSKNNSYHKISGVLVENTFYGNICTYTIIGIGINVGQERFPEDLRNNPISLKLLGYSVDSNDVSMLLVNNISNYLKVPEVLLFDEWKKDLNIEGRNIKILGEIGEWYVEKMHLDGRLEVRNNLSNEMRFIDDGNSIRYQLQKD